MAKITKSLSTKVNKQTGKVEIYFRFIGSSTLILRAKSGIFIDPKQWNSKKLDLKTATFSQEQAETKIKLDNLCTTILNAFTQTSKELVTKEWLNSVIDKFHYPEKYIVNVEAENKPTFFEVFEKFTIENKTKRGTQVSEGRKKHYYVVGRILQNFEHYTKYVEDRDFVLDLDTLTGNILNKIDNFIRTEYEIAEKHPQIYDPLSVVRQPQQRGNNRVIGIMRIIRTFILWTIKNKYTINDPFTEYTIGSEDYELSTPIYINIEERKQIESTDLSAHPQLAIQRDIFIFQCCIGCRVGDLYKFTRQNIVNGAIEYVPRKTKDGRPVTVSVPLNSVAQSIIKRYEVEATKTLLPYISEQKYNDAIKRVFELSGIDRIVQVRNPLTGDIEPRPIYEVASSHLARRTFVGNLYKQVKDPNLVGALSGHKEGSRAFARYRDIDNEMKVELVKLLE